MNCRLAILAFIFVAALVCRPLSAVAQSAGKLSVATYNLTPKEPLKDNLEQARQVAQSTVTVVKTLLYAQSGESAAAAQGRRMFYDPNTLQLTLVDTPENLRTVGDYIKSTATLGPAKPKSEIMFLKHQNSADMQDLLSRTMGASTGSAASASANSVTKTLRVEGELTFRDLKIRVTKVNENDLNDKNDDSVELVVRTATQSEDRTIEEFHSDFVDNYEINVIEVRPSSTPGEGSARIEIRYAPAPGSPSIVTPVLPAR